MTQKVYEGEITTIDPKENTNLKTVVKLAQGIKKLGVRVNADTPKEAVFARQMAQRVLV